MTNPYESPQIHEAAQSPPQTLSGGVLRAEFVTDDQLRRLAAQPSHRQKQGLFLCALPGAIVPIILLVWAFFAEWTPDRFGPRMRLFVESSLLWAPLLAGLLFYVVRRSLIRGNADRCRQHPVLSASGTWKLLTDLNLLVITTERGTMGWQLSQIRFAGHFPLLIRLQSDLQIAVPANRSFSEPGFDPALEAFCRAVQSPAEGLRSVERAALPASPTVSLAKPLPTLTASSASAASASGASAPATSDLIQGEFEYYESQQRASADTLRPWQKRRLYWCLALPAIAFVAVVTTANMQPYIHELWLCAIVSLCASPFACTLWTKVSQRQAALRNFDLQMQHPVVGAMGRWRLTVSPSEIILQTAGGNQSWPTATVKFETSRQIPVQLWLEPDLVIALPTDGDYGAHTYLSMGQAVCGRVKHGQWR